jgi:hypothetical protein
MSVIQLLFDWFMLRPAEALAGFAIVPISLMPIVAAIFAWRWVVRVADGKTTGRASRATALIIAATISGYVLVVTGFAVYYFLFSQIFSSDD